MNRVRVRSTLTRRPYQPVRAGTVTGPIRLVMVRKTTTAPILTGLIGAVPVVLLIVGVTR